MKLDDDLVKQRDFDQNHLQIKDLKRIGLLGSGGFGSVSLLQHTKTGKTYALKSLSKGYVVKTRMENSVQREKQILWICCSDFIIKLYAKMLFAC